MNVNPAGAFQTGGATIGANSESSGRKVFLRDSLIFLVLLLSTVALYAVTSLLFRSFAIRREHLARQFAADGKQALLQKQPEKAVESLRVALEYAPDDRTGHLLLAEALADTHHTDEAMNYFLSLRESEPADGFINLELARLCREKNDSARAVDFYRAATLGNWEENGVEQRLQAQIELSEYLIELNRLDAARAELLMAAGNAPDSVEVNLRLGDELRAAHDPVAALACYEKAVKLEPNNVVALSKAGHEAFNSGDYASAQRLLEQGAKEAEEPSQKDELSALSASAARLVALSMGRNLPAEERGEHARVAASIAKAHLNECAAKFDAAALPAPLQNLKTRWQQAAPLLTRSGMQNVASQDDAVQLVYDTEMQASEVCGAPTGDDALLLRLAKNAVGAAQGKP